jgi:VWFA-related protein
MAVFRLLVISLAAAAAFAQQPADPEPPAQQQDVPPPTTFRSTVDVVVAPVLVTDSNGDFVDGLEASQFHLFDNGKEQDIRVEVAFQPISLVIVIQANSNVESVLPQIRKIGSLIEPLVIGEKGEAAVIKFDHRIEVLQDFTSDSTKVTEAVKKIQPGSSSSRMVDAVNRAVFMLRSRPANRRRIVMLVSETRDFGSEGRARDALLAAQVYNVTIYTANISRFVTTLTAKPQPPRPNTLPPAARPLPASVPATPTAVQATYGLGSRAEFIPLMVELFKDVKAVFKDNPVELFTKGTGGSEYGFVRQRGLEDAIAKIGSELHSQYMVSYRPNNKEEGGFHEIKVEIAGRRDVRTHTRPGYWLAAKFE